MSADTGSYRLITRPDFDGVVCGALFMEQDMIDAVMFATSFSTAARGCRACATSRFPKNS